MGSAIPEPEYVARSPVYLSEREPAERGGARLQFEEPRCERAGLQRVLESATIAASSCTSPRSQRYAPLRLFIDAARELAMRTAK